MREPWPLDGPPLLDRAAHRRASADLAQAESVVTSEGAVLLEGDRLAIVGPRDRGSAEPVAYLGVLDGRDLAAAVSPEPNEPGPGRRWVPLRSALREISGDGSDAEREAASTAVAMAAWHARAAFCPGCGTATVSGEAGWVRRCPREGVDHYPRTDPAVIVAITDPDDRLLLAHVSYHPALRYTHLAGYVEPGESLEQAAHREVGEESRLVLSGLEYCGSQPWPFPASIMVAFRATVADPTIEVDGVEVTDARWFTREELGAHVAEGRIILAPPGSIARRLVHEWYGGALSDGADVPAS